MVYDVSKKHNVTVEYLVSQFVQGKRTHFKASFSFEAE